MIPEMRELICTMELTMTKLKEFHPNLQNEKIQTPELYKTRKEQNTNLPQQSTTPHSVISIMALNKTLIHYIDTHP